MRLKELGINGAIQATLCLQAAERKEELTRGGKPYLDFTFGDHSGVEVLKIWSDSPVFATLAGLALPCCIRLSGTFRRGEYGLEVEAATVQPLTKEEANAFLAGGSAEQIITDWAFVTDTVARMSLHPVRILLEHLFSQSGLAVRFQRASAARHFHHSRRGGLLAHTAQMLRVGIAISPLYPDVCPDLLYAGIILHDLGKVVENDTGAGFLPEMTLRGELIGHIGIGLRLVDRAWEELKKSESLSATPDDLLVAIREHLLHLILSHHGEYEFGSPVKPRIPEAFLLHAIDNMDAKQEMLRQAYEEHPFNDEGICDGGRALKHSLCKPLARLLEGHEKNVESTSLP